MPNSVLITGANRGLGARDAQRAEGVALKPKGINVLSLHPGWVRTDMGGPNAALDPAESAEGIYRVITSADAKHPALPAARRQIVPV